MIQTTRRCSERSGTVEETLGFVSFRSELARLISGTDRIDSVSVFATVGRFSASLICDFLARDWPSDLAESSNAFFHLKQSERDTGSMRNRAAGVF